MMQVTCELRSNLLTEWTLKFCYDPNFKSIPAAIERVKMQY